MKKTLLALAVMGVATSASALEIYNADGVTVDFGGDLELRYQRAIGQDEDFKQVFDDSDVYFDVRYQAMEGVQLGATWGINDLESSQTTGDTFVALYTDTTTVKIGRLCTQTDDAGIYDDQAFGAKSTFQTVDYCDDEIVRVDYDQGQFFGGVAVMQNKNITLVGSDDTALTQSNKLDEDSTFVDVKLGYRVNDFTFEGYYASGDVQLGTYDASGSPIVAPTDETVDEVVTSVQAHYDGLPNTGLKVAYFSTDIDDTEATTLAFNAKYSISEKVSVAGGFSTTSFDSDFVNAGNYDVTEDLTAWFANVNYAIAPGASTFIEIADESADNTDLGASVGVEIEF